MRRKRITKVIALTLCASMMMSIPAAKYAKAYEDTAETEQDEKQDDNEVTWNLKAMEVDEADVVEDNLISQCNKIKIAILDSGIDYSESVNVVERKDFLGEDISPLYEDNTGHGTAIASIIVNMAMSSDYIRYGHMQKKVQMAEMLIHI